MDDIDSRFLAALDRMHPSKFIRRLKEGMFKTVDLPKWGELEQMTIREAGDPHAFWIETRQMWETYRSILKRDPHQGVKTLEGIAVQVQRQDPDTVPLYVVADSALPTAELYLAHRLLLLETMIGYVNVTERIPPTVRRLLERVGEDEYVLYIGLLDAVNAAEEKMARADSKDSEEAYRKVVDIGRECLDRIRNGVGAREIREEFPHFLDYLGLGKDEENED